MEKIIPNGTEVLIFKYIREWGPNQDDENYTVGTIQSSKTSDDLSVHGSPYYVQIYEVLGTDGKKYIGTYGTGLIGNSFFIHQMPRIMDAAKPYILSLHPELEGVGVDVVIKSFEDAKAFVDEQKKIYGDKLSLTPMSKTDGYSYVEPMEEIFEIKAGRR